MTKRKPAPPTRAAPELLHEMLGDLATSSRGVDPCRLERDYGAGVASEVLRQVIRSRAAQKKRR